MMTSENKATKVENDNKVLKKILKKPYFYH
jgi:hypothetical protein